MPKSFVVFKRTPPFELLTLSIIHQTDHSYTRPLLFDGKCGKIKNRKAVQKGENQDG
jgi:hypothetical protein